MIYKALGPLPGTVCVDVIGREIDAIRPRFGGICPPAAYVDAARPPDSPIHETLPWDDAVLAEQARREVARSIIQVVVVAKNEADTPPRNVHVTIVKDDDIYDGYASVATVLRRPILRNQVLRELVARIRGDLRNHSWLTELEPVMAAIVDVEESIARTQEPELAAAVVR